MKSYLCFWFASLVVAFLQCTTGCNVELVTRAGWGAREPKHSEPMQMPVPHIFIHHTATASCDNQDSCAEMMRSIQRYHMDDRGWEDIGYNFLIGGDGRVYIGRGWDKVGAHTYGFNRNAIAFSLMGNFVQNAPPAIMLNATQEMIKCASDEEKVSEGFKIHGHRDGVCTECPGQALYDIIKTWDGFEAGPLPGYNCRYS